MPRFIPGILPPLISGYAAPTFARVDLMGHETLGMCLIYPAVVFGFTMLGAIKAQESYRKDAGALDFEFVARYYGPLSIWNITPYAPEWLILNARRDAVAFGLCTENDATPAWAPGERPDCLDMTGRSVFWRMVEAAPIDLSNIGKPL